MIDLHTHTTYSDGTWTVKELLEKAEEKNIELLAITDHDTVKAHLELEKIDYSDYFSGKIIPGAEFNCVFNNAKIELLGYNFDIHKMNEWIEKTYNKKNAKPNLLEEFNLLMNACYKNGIKIDEINYNENMGWPIDYVYEGIKKYEENKKYFTDKEWNDIDHFFRCCTCNTDFPLYIDFSYQTPSAKLVSDEIRMLGGKVFLAHLFTYPLRDHEKYLDSLVEENIIDGIETYYSKFTEEEIKFIKDYCIKNNLYMSAGTDCHGDKKPDRQVGIGYGNMNVEIDVVKDWI